MKKNDFWVLSLVVLSIITAVNEGNVCFKILLALNAIIVLIDVIYRMWVIYNGRRKKKD